MNIFLLRLNFLFSTSVSNLECLYLQSKSLIPIYLVFIMPEGHFKVSLLKFRILKRKLIDQNLSWEKLSGPKTVTHEQQLKVLRLMVLGKRKGRRHNFDPTHLLKLPCREVGTLTVSNSYQKILCFKFAGGRHVP